MREPTDEEMLGILQEECAEVIHIISKIRRFGIEDFLPDGSGLTNRSRLTEEMLDVQAMLDWVKERGISVPVSSTKQATCKQNKRDKVRKYLR